MFFHLFLGFLGAILSGLAFGPINLSVVSITISKDLKAGIRFSAAAAFVETFHAWMAILFGKLFLDSINTSVTFQTFVVLFFLGLGTYFILKKDQFKLEKESKKKSSDFFKGFAIALLNPQAIPGWLFIIAVLNSYGWLEWTHFNLITFLIGAAAGKYLILGIYGYFSHSIKDKIDHLCGTINKSIGILLILIGIYQIIRFSVM